MATAIRDLVPDYEDFRDSVVASMDDNATIHIGDLCSYPHEDQKLVSFEELILMMAGGTESLCTTCFKQAGSLYVSRRLVHG